MDQLEIGSFGAYPEWTIWDHLCVIPEESAWEWMHRLWQPEMQGTGYLRFRYYPSGAHEVFAGGSESEDWHMTQRIFPNKEFLVVGNDHGTSLGKAVAIYCHDSNIHDNMFWIIRHRTAWVSMRDWQRKKETDRSAIS